METKFGLVMKLKPSKDFTSSSDFVIFEEQRNLYGHLCQPGTAIMVRGRYLANRSGDIRFNIASINPLEQFRGKLIRGITFNLALTDCPEFTERILKQEKQRDGQRVEVRFVVYAPDINRNIMLTSSKHIYINKSFLTSLTEDGIPFTIDKFNQ